MKTGDRQIDARVPLERWIVREVLRQPDQLAMSFMNARNIGIAICDLQFRFRTLNPALARMNGIPLEEHIGKTIYEVLGDFAAKVEPLFQQVVSSGNPVVNVHVTGKLPMQSELGHWIENYFPLKDSKGAVRRLCCMVFEVTEQKRLEESLQIVTQTCKDEMAQLSVLAEFHSRLLNKPDPTELAGAITAFVNRQIPHDYAVLMLEENTLKWLGPDSRQQALPDPADERSVPYLRYVAASAKAEGMHRQAEDWKPVFGRGVQSMLTMRIATRGAKLGTLHLASRHKGVFDGVAREMANRLAEQIALALDYVCTTNENESLKSRLKEPIIEVNQSAERPKEFSELVGDSPALQRVLRKASTVAKTDATVLILGETGTGKGLSARAVHLLSKRCQEPFVKINCSAIPTESLESDLFGHERGAFKGAISRKLGKLQEANRGTLLLDEIGDLPPALQSKLLRVLQDGEFERLGGKQTIRVNVRVIAATNRDLKQRVEENLFRGDLFYRLNVFPMRMPSLREKKEDVAVLVRHFVSKFNREMGKDVETVPRALMHAMLQWDWPGNVRELEHFIERSMIMTTGKVLQGSALDLQQPTATPVDRTLAAMERDYILQVLRQTGGKVAGMNGAAARLGMKRSTLQSRMQKLQIHHCDYKTTASSVGGA